ncbi:MAG TPA: CBS domain-containing protein [Acidimicrobiia bacterium]|jgi:CBS domain-containing protein|nr:CBS domain-containing protein [Acidimicrobiia bacterium]
MKTQAVTELRSNDGTDRTAITEHDHVVKLIARTPVVVSLDATLREAAEILTEESIGALLVRAPHGPAGVLSERDIVAALAEGADPDRDRARDFMTPDIASVAPTATILEARERMVENEIRHLLVSKGETTMGLVSMRDILATVPAARHQAGPQ